MKLLFVGFSAKYINKTNFLIPYVLKNFATTDCYGPGYTDKEILSLGLESYISKNGPYDLICTTSQLGLEGDASSILKFYQNFSINSWGGLSIEGFISNSQNFLRNYKGNRVTFLLDLDPYAVQEKDFTNLLKISDYFVGLGKDFTKPNANLKYLESETDIKKKSEKMPLGLWHDFASKHENKFINLGHFVSFDEFDFNNIGGRQYDVSVPGQLYLFRKNTKKQLLDEGWNVGLSKHKLIYSSLTKLGLRPYGNIVLHSINNILFQQLLNKSKICITDGGNYDFWVRKFVEIPAAGSIICARPCAGFNAMGFVDRVNCIEVEENNLAEKIRELISKPVLLKEIAKNGQNLVWEQHSSEARAQQLQRAFKAICSKTLKKTYWEDGKFNLN